MNTYNSYFNGPIKIAVYFAITLAVAAAAFLYIVGPEQLLVYASESKPYSLLFSRIYYQDLLNDDQSAKIICFGDSGFFFPPDASFTPNPETSDVHIPGLIREEISARGMLPKPKLIEWAYAGANTFDYYCLFYKAIRFSPDLIIIPINWRAFSFDWATVSEFFHPELSAFVPLRSELPSVYKDPVRSQGISVVDQIKYKSDFISLYVVGFKNWASETGESLLASQKRSAGSDDSTDFRPTEKREPKIFPEKLKAGTLRAFFPMTISESNIVVQRLSALGHVASKHDTKILFFIWPIDKELLAETGILDESKFELSKKTIAEAIGAKERKNLFFADLSGLLKHEYFYDIFGHCTVDGRKKIAEALAPQIIAILENPEDPKDDK